MADDVTVGEVSRQVSALHVSHLQSTLDLNKRLEEIWKQVFLTNGTVGRHEEKLATHGRDIEQVRTEQSRAAWAIFGLILTVAGGVITWWLTRPHG